MPATITAEERAMIDAKVAAGKVTRYPTGKSAFADEYVWEDGKGLVTRNPEMAKANFRRFTFGTRKSRAPSPEQIKRRETVASLMDADMTGVEIATMIGVNVQTVYEDAKVMGRKFPRPTPPRPKSPPHVAARREKVAALVAEGMNSAMISDRLGIMPRTVWDDVKALGLRLPRDYSLRKPAKKTGPKPSPKVAARRAKLPGLIARGMNGPEIARHLDVNVSAIRHDCKHLGLSIPRRSDRIEMQEAA